MSRKKVTPALAYFRTSSATNVGADKDSEKRQREAVTAFARRAGYEIEAEFYDAAVSGADPVDVRPGFAALLARVAGNGVKVVIVETANRFARDLIVQETGHRMLRNLGIELIAADSPDSFVDDTPTAILVRQILGAVAQFEKAALVAKLKGARDRVRKTARQVRRPQGARRAQPGRRGTRQAPAPCEPEDWRAHVAAPDQRRAEGGRPRQRARPRVQPELDQEHGRG